MDEGTLSEAAAKWIAEYDRIDTLFRTNFEAIKSDRSCGEETRSLQFQAERQSRDYRRAKMADDARRILEGMLAKERGGA